MSFSWLLGLSSALKMKEIENKFLYMYNYLYGHFRSIIRQSWSLLFLFIVLTRAKAKHVFLSFLTFFFVPLPSFVLSDEKAFGGKWWYVATYLVTLALDPPPRCILRVTSCPFVFWQPFVFVWPIDIRLTPLLRLLSCSRAARKIR